MSEEEVQPPVDDTESEESSEESEDEATPDEPATPLLTNQTLPDVTRQLDDLHLEMTDDRRGRDPTPAPTAERVVVSNGSFKVNSPTEFSGQRNQVKTFKLQCLTYLHLNHDKLNNDRKRLLFLTSYLRGPAYEWILPHLEDYLDHPAAGDQKATTRSILTNAATFFEQLQTAFGYGSEKMEAERALQNIQQRGPVSKYKAEFQTLVVKTNWDDHAITSHFYRGLKDVIKDEIARRDSRPATFQEMYEVALKIDERIYERQMEKKGVYQGRANTKVQRDVPAWNNNYYGLQKMQLDATKGKPGSNKGSKNNSNKRPQSKTKGTTDKSNVECYGCGKKGHYKNECNARKQRHDLQGSGQNSNRDREFRATKGDGNDKAADKKQVKSIKATQGRGSYDLNGTNIADRNLDDHGMVTWTACFEDECAIHLSDKFGSGYWPAKKTRSVCRTIGGPGQGIRYTAGYPPQEESSDEEESSEEEGEIAESDGEPEELETTEFTRTADSNDAILRVLRLVWESKNFILPWNGDGDEQMVNERELWILIGKIRAALWRMPHEKHSTDYTRVVQEYPPLGSTFTSDSSYTTREGIIFSPELRSRLQTVKRAFCEEAATQAREGGAQYSSGSVELYTLPQRLAPPQIMFEEPEEVRRRPQTIQQRPQVVESRPRTLQVRPPTPYTSERSVWEPALNISDPNYVPRRPISMRGTQAEGSLDPRRQVILGRTSLPSDAGN
jgi:hypothetical protein